MKILVINTGSSSIKYELFDMDMQKVLAAGIAEKIGEDSGVFTHKRILSNGKYETKVGYGRIPDHHEGLNRIVGILIDKNQKIIKDKTEIRAIGHRVVHGGDTFHSTTLINAKVISAIEQYVPLAPLHNPANLTGIEVAQSVFPDALQVAVFDTAFHQTIPMKAFLYAIPYEIYEKHKVRKYGFHGTSHAYVAECAARYLDRPLGELNLITIHLGNGSSMAAIKNGKCIDTTMGMTPLAGLVMGTRSGDLDPSVPFFLMDNMGLSLKDINRMLNQESGLKGICGTNDMREVIEKMNAGDKRAKIALDIYTYRIKKFIGSYFAVLESLDCIVFTAGIGENAPYIREYCLKGLNMLGIELDSEQNKKAENGIKEISSLDSAVKVLVVPTNEELKIALETKKIIENSV